jgi:hypothetical protein
MSALSAEQLGLVLAAQFSPKATCWSQATDEIRDMCRLARNMAGLSDEHAVNFRAFNTPSQWNTEGIAGILKFYRMLSPERQAEFCEDWSQVLEFRIP